MAKAPTYHGMTCKTDCSGHRAGRRYAMNGGRALTKSSRSFNEGMRIAQKQLKKKGVKSRMGIKKVSK